MLNEQKPNIVLLNKSKLNKEKVREKINQKVFKQMRKERNYI